MYTQMRAVTSFFLVSFLFLASPADVVAQPSDADALKGLDSARVVFDITQGDPEKLLGRLKLVERTAEMVAEQGVTPDFVLAFRGPASFYASTDREKIPLEKHVLADDVAAQIEKMSQQEGVRFEQCSVATSFLKIDNATIHKSIKVVGNSWISLAGYQNRGYAYIPID